jgi:hypothetical protein
VFDSILAWITGGHKPAYPHKEEAYPIAWQIAEGKAGKGLGIEIAPDELTFLIEGKAPAKEFNVAVMIRKTHIPIRVHVLRDKQVLHEGKPWHQIQGRIIAIAADHWDLLLRFVTDEPEPTNLAADQIKEIQAKGDDEYRLMPLKVQKRLIELLVLLHRMDPVAEGQMPPIRLLVLGEEKTKKGETLRRINIHSRAHTGDVAMAYDTQFTIDDQGNVKALG